MQDGPHPCRDAGVTVVVWEWEAKGLQRETSTPICSSSNQTDMSRSSPVLPDLTMTGLAPCRLLYGRVSQAGLPSWHHKPPRTPPDRPWARRAPLDALSSAPLQKIEQRCSSRPSESAPMETLHCFCTRSARGRCPVLSDVLGPSCRQKSRRVRPPPTSAQPPLALPSTLPDSLLRCPISVLKPTTLLPDPRRCRPRFSRSVALSSKHDDLLSRCRRCPGLTIAVIPRLALTGGLCCPSRLQRNRHRNLRAQSSRQGLCCCPD